MNMGQEYSPSFSSSSVSRSVWAEAEKDEADSNSTSAPETHLGLILACSAIILVLVVALVAWLATSRSEKAMARLLAEKGSSLLMVFESALKTGMKDSSGLQLQTLLEEITNSPDIEFVALTMPDGVILAHSDNERIGEVFHLENEDLDENKMSLLAPGEEEKWKIASSEGHRVFLLYRNFTLGQKDWPGDVPEPVIFLGMDVSPFEITNSQNRSYATILSLVLMLAGLSCLLAVSFAQRAAESRKKQDKAETEVARLEGEVRRNEKMAAIGTLAAGVAHEIRNPLSSIKGYATYFTQRFPEGSEDREAAAVMVNEVNRLNRVITDLLGLAKPTDVKLKPVCMELVLRHVLRLLRQNASNHNVDISLKIAKLVPEIMADMERLSQALLNLCLNAMDAMEKGGTLLLAVSGGHKKICIMVSDTGKGIAPDIIQKIFDPYFTTKRTGTGLGLPMVHKIIKGHSGQVDVSSCLEKRDEEGRLVKAGGTIFRLYLPITPSGDKGGNASAKG